ncbi:MAG: hypothetical protein JRI36_01500 [Deltaproteobacteria bacterium]|nr:hypothetical protein [Deltaproteobacteria bacterium]
MGTSLKIFLINHDDTIQAFPRARYERLLRGDPGERVPEFAGQRIRCAVVVVEMGHHRPIAISRIVYSFLRFDASGRIDIEERERETRMALEVAPPAGPQKRSGPVIDARHLFAKRRYEHEFRWHPTAEIKAAIVDHIFGREITPV